MLLVGEVRLGWSECGMYLTALKFLLKSFQGPYLLLKLGCRWAKRQVITCHGQVKVLSIFCCFYGCFQLSLTYPSLLPSSEPPALSAGIFPINIYWKRKITFF